MLFLRITHKLNHSAFFFPFALRQIKKKKKLNFKKAILERAE